MSEDKNLEITGSPVPYEDGDHCIFFAVQEATMHFNKKPLTRSELVDYQSSRIRHTVLAQRILGDVKSKHFITSSLRIISTKLGEHGIRISKIHCDPGNKQFLETDHFIKRSGIDVENVGRDGELELSYPSLLIIQSSDQDTPHVWCVTSSERFKSDFNQHIGPKDKIVLATNLEKT
jgi:hypothetical protein